MTSPANLSGDWLLHLGNGEEIAVNINQVDASNIFINADRIHISGRYALAGNHLTLLDAKQPRISGVELIGKNDGSWIVIAAPTAARTGYQLEGSSLTRAVN